MLLFVSARNTSFHCVIFSFAILAPIQNSLLHTAFIVVVVVCLKPNKKSPKTDYITQTAFDFNFGSVRLGSVRTLTLVSIFSLIFSSYENVTYLSHHHRLFASSQRIKLNQRKKKKQQISHKK